MATHWVPTWKKCRYPTCRAEMSINPICLWHTDIQSWATRIQEMQGEYGGRELAPLLIWYIPDYDLHFTRHSVFRNNACPPDVNSNIDLTLWPNPLLNHCLVTSCNWHRSSFNYKIAASIKQPALLRKISVIKKTIFVGISVMYAKRSWLSNLHTNYLMRPKGGTNVLIDYLTYRC